jgi:hypothetical protein
MSFADIKYTKCPGCGERRLMTGRNREYNPRSKLSNLQICVDCKTNEIMNGVK